jgi:hypothetical protein
VQHPRPRPFTHTSSVAMTGVSREGERASSRPTLVMVARRSATTAFRLDDHGLRAESPVESDRTLVAPVHGGLGSDSSAETIHFWHRKAMEHTPWS